MPQADRFSSDPGSFTGAPTETPKGESGTQKIGKSYMGDVRAALIRFGSPTPDVDMANTNDFWMHCQIMGVPAEVAAGLIYATERHKHAQSVGSTTLKEASRIEATEAPTFRGEEWEVTVKRSGGSMEKIIAAAGKKPDEVVRGNVIFGEFYDDEKALSFARKMTDAGFIATLGPRRRMAAEKKRGRAKEPVAVIHEQSQAPDWGQRRFLKLIKEVRINSGRARVADLRDRLPSLPRAEFDRTLVRMQREGFVVLYPIDNPQEMKQRDIDSAINIAGDPRMLVYIAPAWESAAEAKEPVAVVHERRIPWIKVSRDPKAQEQYQELAARFGPIKDLVCVNNLVGPDLAHEDQEIFLVIPLNLRGELKTPPYEIARGQRSKEVVGVEDVMRAILDAGGEGFICVHNHPSGDPHPSDSDIALTKQIQQATVPYGSGIKFLDHCIITPAKGCSIFEWMSSHGKRGIHRFKK